MLSVYNYRKTILSFSFLLFILGAYGQKNDIQIIRMSSTHTSFPDTGRRNGYTYDNVFYSAGDHYNDSSIILIFPKEIKKDKKIDFIFWFHGWNNNIDTALVFYELKKQFIASNRQAVFVLAQTAVNAPDSYGGKLEQQGVFKGLVSDITTELKKTRSIRSSAITGNIVIGGHSGAYRVIAYILKNGQLPVQEVFLFDALYGQVDTFLSWIRENNQHHFVNWYTNHGGGTDKVSVEMMQELNGHYMLIEEQGINPSILKKEPVLFIHSEREHNLIINNPDNLQLMLENSKVLKTLHFFN